MAVVRVHKNSNYTTMSNYHFKEKKMSLKAKGLLSLMLSLPDDWDYSIAGLSTLSKDGKDSVMTALKELEKFGYLQRTRLQDSKGQFIGYDYDIFEEPSPQVIDEETAENQQPYSKNPYAENPNTDKPNAENPPQLNTNILNTNNNKILNNKDKIDKIDKSKNAVLPNEIIENNNYSFIEPKPLTKQLLNCDYIEEDDMYINEYNNIFDELLYNYDLSLIRSALNYFTQRIKWNGCIDEYGNEITNKLAYFKTAILSGINRLLIDNGEIKQNNDVGYDWLRN